MQTLRSQALIGYFQAFLCHGPLKEELRAQGIRVPLTESYLRDLVIDADASARQTAPSKEISHTYVSRFRAAIRARAEFVRAWTLSDDRIDSDAAFNDRMIKLAHAYALPR